MGTEKTEILAPVGNFESLYAAVRSGADAVYFGCKDFSARRNAVNFSFEEMADAVKYCKKNKVKTYLTVNIAIKTQEFEKAVETARQAYLCGVDGLIVSDLGLARTISKMFPDIELHASTQMSVNSHSALKPLKEIGFCRVVPAREMSKNELILLCKEAEKLNMEVEVFVHGALCMCLSGQCLLSSVLGGRSGNRGLCAGPCRLPFAVENGTGYDLSLKDLSLLQYISELCNMGVTSFKIEGRMKRPEYIAAAVSACRSAADKGAVGEQLDSCLKNVFSRSGFTDGYYTGKTGREMFGIRSRDDAEKSKETYAFLHSLYRNELSKIPVDITAKIQKDEPIKLEIKTEDISVSVSGEIPKAAINSPAEEETVRAALSKFGGTSFKLQNAEILLDEGLFVSNRDLNELRRKAVEALENRLAEIPKRRINEYEFSPTDSQKRAKAKLYAKFLDLSEIPDDLSGIETIIIPLEKIGENLPEFNNIAVEIPRFTSDENKIKKLLKTAKSKGLKTAFCDTLSAIELAKESGFEVKGGAMLNVLNEASADVLKSMNVSAVTLSDEMLLSRAERFKTPLHKGVFAYGRLPLMAFRNCPIKNGKSCGECDKKGYITDRTDTKFPIRCRNGFSEMFNSKPVYLADKLANTQNFDFFILSFTVEKSGEIRDIIDSYLYGRPPTKDFTRGLYFKDVI